MARPADAGGRRRGPRHRLFGRLDTTASGSMTPGQEGAGVPGALLRWWKSACGGAIRPGRCQITRASSANASARRDVSGASVPRS
jgi:hypothetical protein